MDKLLKNLNIIVTGAASWIGKAITEKCIVEGANIIAIDIDANKLEDLQNLFSWKNISTYQADISNWNWLNKTFSSIIKDQEVDWLVNNAGIYFGKNIFEYDESMVDKVIWVNIKWAFNLSRLFWKYCLEKKRKWIIVNISSISAQEWSSDAVYWLTKAAILWLTKSTAINFSPFVRVNAIAPTIVETDMMNNIPKSRIEDYRQKELLESPLLAENVADSAIFLLSDMSKNYTWTTLDINNWTYLR
jgi:3-oxoacyl-[acyl-carrier protein] reductase